VNSGVAPNSVMLASTGGAELGDVGQHRHLHRFDKFLVRGQIVGGLGKDAVGASFHTGDRALDGGVHAFSLDRVGAGNQEEVRIGFGVGGGLYPVHHFVLADDLLARTMTTALGTDLVFDMAGGRTGLDQALDRALDVEGARAEAGVDVDHQRQIADIGDAANVDQHVVECVDAQIRQAQRTGGDATPGEIDRLKAGPLGEQRVVGIDGTDHLQGLFGGEGGAESGTSGNGHAFILGCLQVL